MTKRTIGRALAMLALTSHGGQAQQPGRGTTPTALLQVEDLTAGSASSRTAWILGTLAPGRQSALVQPVAGVRRDSLMAQLYPEHVPKPASLIWWDSPLFRMWINTGGSRQDRDGAVWQGNGVTGAISGGFLLRKRNLSVAMRPVAFVSQNAAFRAPNPARGDVPAFRHATWGHEIDLPLRFGGSPYAALDPGESHVELASKHVAGGFTTASERWGPSDRFPLVLGTEAAGFPRAFVHAMDVPVGFGEVQARWLFGVLEASTESGLPVGVRSRVASALAASFVPAVLPALEIGAARFFHIRREQGGLSWTNATWPFTGLLKTQSRDVALGGANQLASVFARVAPAGAGVEAYAEFYREDHNANVRDLAGEPDHASAYSVGLRRAWRVGTEVASFTFEHANGRISHLTRVRGQSPIYTHSTLREGHTHRGQALGSSDLIGGGGMSIVYDRIGAHRSYFLEAEVVSTAQNGEGGTWNGVRYGEYVVGGGRYWRRGRRSLGTAITVRRGYGGRGDLSGTLALTLR